MTTKMLDQKIEKLKERVDKVQAEYDALAKELKELMDKRKTIQANEILKALEKSGKSIEEVLEYITA